MAQKYELSRRPLNLASRLNPPRLVIPPAVAATMVLYYGCRMHSEAHHHNHRLHSQTCWPSYFFTFSYTFIGVLRLHCVLTFIKYTVIFPLPIVRPTSARRQLLLLKQHPLRISTIARNAERK